MTRSESACSDSLANSSRAAPASDVPSQRSAHRTGYASAARAVLSEAVASDQEKCLAEGSAAALALARRKGWTAEQVSSCVDAFPQYCDINCHAGVCNCRWHELGAGIGFASSASPRSSQPIGLVHRSAYVDGLKAGMGSLLEDGVPDVLESESKEWPSQHGGQSYLQHGSFVSGQDNGAMRRWETVYRSTQLDRESALKDDKEWTSRSYLFQSPQMARWVRIKLDERAYRAYGFEIKQFCVVPCP